MSLLKQWTSEGLLSPHSFSRLNRFIDLLVEWNSHINLTGLQSRSEIEQILVGESILAAHAFPLGGKRVLDVGSGAGIPGLVWALQEPSIVLTSIEIREKKIAFQKEAIRTLELDVEVIKAQFPDAVRGRKFDAVVFRAVKFTQQLEKQAISFLNPGGAVVRFVAAEAVEEGWEARRLSSRSTLLIRRTDCST